MKHTAEDRGQSDTTMQSLYAPVQAEMLQVEDCLRREFSSSDLFVDRLARHGFRLGGKRLRPALVLMAGQLCGGITSRHVPLAAAMEMIHTATLLHDDVLDEATMRRHLDTVNARFDNEASILLGDYLLGRAIALVGSLDCPHACKLIGDSARTVCEGELRQVFWRGKFDLTEQDYLQIIADKTAALTSCSCELGAYYACDNLDWRERLNQYGRHLGIAFQIADDLLDVLGNEAMTGKSLGTDLIKQKPTLPLIRLLCQAAPADRAAIVDTLRRDGNHRAEALQPWFRASDALAYAQATAVRYGEMAAADLDVFPDTPARRSLLALTNAVTVRGT